MNGLPDETNELCTPINGTISPNPFGDWVSVGFPETNITDGDFWILIEWKTPPLGKEKGKNSFFIGRDAKLDHRDRSFMRWSQKGKWKRAKGDWMINALFLK